MKKIIRILAVSILCCYVLAGCTTVVTPPRPRPHRTWIPGHHAPRGAWVPGHWRRVR